MSRKYSQLSIEERAVIMVLNDQGIILRAIAQRLQRAPSTINREFNRNHRQGAYRATVAHQKMVKRRRQPSFKLVTNQPLWLLIQRLKNPWGSGLTFQHLRLKNHEA